MGYEDLSAGRASTVDFATGLIASVSPGEWRQLEEGGFEGEVSAFNRAVLLRLRDCSADDVASKTFDVTAAERMANMLQDFLDEHLPDNPRAQRWIRVSCLALAFVFREPLHPIEVVKAETRVIDGKVTYYCPACEGDETLCGYCVCHPTSELPSA